MTQSFEQLMARITEDTARVVGRAMMPAAFRMRDELTQTVERLTAYGQAYGLTEEEAREVIDVWSRETKLSLTRDEKVFRAPLMWRAHGHRWHPGELAMPDLQARALVPHMPGQEVVDQA